LAASTIDPQRADQRLARGGIALVGRDHADERVVATTERGAGGFSVVYTPGVRSAIAAIRTAACGPPWVRICTGNTTRRA
jgi:hypothetical protein